MNPSTSRAIDRLMRQANRPPPQRRGGFSSAPIVLSLGLVLGYLLTSRFVPMAWASLLPGGLEQARFFRGWPGLVWRMALACHRDFAGTVMILAAIGGLGFVLSAIARPLRPIVWLMAVATIGIDAGIVYITLRAAIEATAANAGLM